MSGQAILFTGQRGGAFRAARRMGYRVLVCDKTPQKASLAALVDEFIPVADLAHLPDAPTGVCAVVALTEGSVLPAAELRARWHLQGLLPEVALRCHDKRVMKERVRAMGIPCAEYVVLGEHAHGEELLQKLGLPLVLKAPNLSGGRGTLILEEREHSALVNGKLDTVLKPGWLAEKFIYGPEMSVESFVHAGRVQWSSPTHYLVQKFANVVPAQVSDRLWQKIQDFNARVITALGIERGITHLEIFLTEEGFLLGEIAVRPPGGCLMNLIQMAYGADPWEAWLCSELGEAPSFPEKARQHAGVMLLHPGSGTVRAVRGESKVRELKHFKRCKIRVKAGDTISARVGTGQDVGRVFAVAPSFDEVSETLLAAHDLIKFEF